MLVIIKSSPDTPEGKRGFKLARDMASDIVLLQNGVYFGNKDRFEGFCGKVYILEEDMRLRGLKSEEMLKDAEKIDYDRLVDLMVEEDKVIGMF
ncbi:MAG: sulfurtransferase complex subunit TusB [Thermodesulfovibrionales bacterium]|nr:sulfurtransferase complex subunit TusB [Thermodesulfovibrionales bacterium]